MRNGIIISMLLVNFLTFLKSLTKRYIFRLTKCEHKDVSESIDSDDRNFSWSLNKFLNIFKPEYFIPGVLWKGPDLYFRYFDTI